MDRRRRSRRSPGALGREHSCLENEAIRRRIAERIDGFNMNTAASLAACQPEKAGVRYVPVAVDLEFARLEGELEVFCDRCEQINSTG